MIWKWVSEDKNYDHWQGNKYKIIGTIHKEVNMKINEVNCATFFSRHKYNVTTSFGVSGLEGCDI